MATDVKSTAINEDLVEVCRLAAEGKKVTDPDLLQRIRERSATVREEALRNFGVQDIGVQIIRELRDGQ